MGANGAGKSTLLSALAGAFDPELEHYDSLSPVRFNPACRLVYFDQSMRDLPLDTTILDYIAEAPGVSDKDAIRYLAPAGFPFAKVDEPIGVLSHGERARLVFLKMKLLRPNMYLLDEPTNHLDIEGQEDLEEQLEQSDVSCLFVSHDRYFTRTVATAFWRSARAGWSRSAMPRLLRPGRLAAMDLPLDKRLSLGVQTLHRRTEPATGPWSPTIDEMADLLGLLDRCGYHSLGRRSRLLHHRDPRPAVADRAGRGDQPAPVFGTGVYLLPLRHPTPVAKQVSTLDHLTEGRFIFGVRVGGEFPREYEACGVPLGERGARLSESIVVLRKLWTGEPASHDGRFFKFENIPMQPPPRQPGGPPIWAGGRSDAALRRTGRMADGWMSYVVTPDMFRQGLEKIATAAARGQTVSSSAASSTSASTCSRSIDDTYEKALDAATISLSQRYAMDFRKAAQALLRTRHAAAGRRDRAALPRRRGPVTHCPGLRRSLRAARPADRALRLRGDAAVWPRLRDGR